MELRLLICHRERMLRSLHDRWPYRRSHCRHDLHLLVRVHPTGCRRSIERSHTMAGLRNCNRRPEED